MKLKLFKITQVLIASLLASGINTASAAAIGNANGTTTLTITDIINTTNPGDLTSLSITGDSDSPFIFTDFFGNANTSTSSSATQSGSVVLGVGEGLQQSSELATQASPSGNAEGSILTFSTIDLFNNSSTDTFEISFFLDYSLSVFKSISSIVLEDVGTLAQIILLDETFEIDIEESLQTDVINESFTGFLGDTMDFSLTLDPNSSNQLALEVNLVASAQSVPEPNVLWLILVGASSYYVPKFRKLA